VDLWRAHETDFVRAGGGLLIGSLGWSWQPYKWRPTASNPPNSWLPEVGVYIDKEDTYGSRLVINSLAELADQAVNPCWAAGTLVDRAKDGSIADTNSLSDITRLVTSLSNYVGRSVDGSPTHTVAARGDIAALSLAAISAACGGHMLPQPISPPTLSDPLIKNQNKLRAGCLAAIAEYYAHHGAVMHGVIAPGPRSEVLRVDPIVLSAEYPGIPRGRHEDSPDSQTVLETQVQIDFPRYVSTGIYGKKWCHSRFYECFSQSSRERFF
jgi:hypothetical protein